jgi:hypothetical protein
VGLVGQGLAVGAGDAGGGEGTAEQAANALGGDGAVLQADSPLGQQGHRRVPGALPDVVGRDEGDGAVGAAGAGDDGGQDVGELRVDDKEPFLVGLGRRDGQERDELASGGEPVLDEAVVGQLVEFFEPVWRRTSMADHAQNALSSSRIRSRRLPVPGSSAQVRGDASGRGRGGVPGRRR